MQLLNKVFKLLPFVLLIMFKAITSEITFEGTGKAIISGIEFNDTSSYKLYQSNGHWKSTSGDYGLHECYGTLNSSKKKEINFDVYCKYTSQDNEYFILKISRDSEYQESGFGSGLILETSSKYKHFLGAKCNHAVTYLDLDYFAMQKCKYE